MSLNYLEIEKVLNELDLQGSYLQNIHQPEHNKLLLHFFKKVCINVLVCIDSQEVRLHQTWKKYSHPLKLPRFAQLLRARIKGSRLIRIFQLEHNRIIKLEFQKAQQTYFLWLKLWTNQANIILSDSQNKIIDCFLRKPVKKEISGQLWLPPAFSTKKQDYQLRFDENLNYSRQLEKFYEDKETKTQENKELKKYHKLLNQQKSHYKQTLKYLESELAKNSQEVEQLKIWANLLFSYCPQLEGLSNIQLDSLVIPTAGMLDPKELAKKYLEKYKKLKEKIKHQKLKQASVKENLLKTQEALTKIEVNGEISQDFKQKQTLNTTNNNLCKTHKPSVGLKFLSAGFTITIGRNAHENDELLRRQVKAQDMWLHLRDFPGCFAFISHQKGKSFPLEVLLDAASLALYFSHKKKIVNADFYYTLVKNLRRVKGAKLGTVVPNKEKNLRLTLDEKRLERLFNTKIDNP